jgi:Spy/CpxP family protein refolding chaperone
MRSLIVVALVLACAAPLAAQQTRQIKSLSEAEIEGYLRGEGMGFAKVAELNHYPGPRHVLDLADPLELSVEQRRAAQVLFERMRAEAIELGTRLVAAEAELDRLFAEREIDEARLRASLHEIARLQAEIRGVHLRAHLEMRELLGEEQIARYDRLRGYAPGHDGAGASHGGHGPRPRR